MTILQDVGTKVGAEFKAHRLRIEDLEASVSEVNSRVSDFTYDPSLADTQFPLSQIVLGFAGLLDGDLIVNYPSLITNVTLSNGEISITY